MVGGTLHPPCRPRRHHSGGHVRAGPLPQPTRVARSPPQRQRRDPAPRDDGLHRPVGRGQDRLSTVTMADRIIVMGAGWVKAAGAHAELAARNPLHAELAATQLLASTETRWPDPGTGRQRRSLAGAPLNDCTGRRADYWRGTTPWPTGAAGGSGVVGAEPRLRRLTQVTRGPPGRARGCAGGKRPRSRQARRLPAPL